jgi:DNA-binding transcriptional MerR regulator
MFKIGEFSRLGQVSTRMLRHYDKLGLLVPSHTDKWTGYRYYTLDQLSRLHRIIALKELGFSLQDIVNLLDKEDGLSVTEMRGMLLLKQRDVRQEISEASWRLQQIEARLVRLEAEGQPSPYEIVIKPVAEMAVASVRTIVPHIQDMEFFCEKLTRQVYIGLAAADVQPLQPELILYHPEEYQETDVDVEAAVAVHPKYLRQQVNNDRISFRLLPGYEAVAALIYEGPLRDVLPTVLMLLSWVAATQHVPAGPLRELHLSGPAHADNAVDEEMVTEFQLPIAPVAEII